MISDKKAIEDDRKIDQNTSVLVTGAAGFVGCRVVNNLVNRGFKKIRCFVRNAERAVQVFERNGCNTAALEIVEGNLMSIEDCRTATKGVNLIFHLAAGSGTRAFAEAFLNSVVTTRNLLQAGQENGELARFVNISSFAVYSNRNKKRGKILDEESPIQERPEKCGDAYRYAKIKQDELVTEFCKKHNISYVLMRPGSVYGPGKNAITGRVGTGTFGVFLHLGGSNQIPLTYVDNCAEAIVLSGLTSGCDGEIINIVDDDLPSSRNFLSSFKKNVVHFPSIYLPHFASYLLCFAWEKYCVFSDYQLPPAFNQARWYAEWKSSRYTNEKLKRLLGWEQTVPTAEGLQRFFAYCKNEYSKT